MKTGRRFSEKDFIDSCVEEYLYDPYVGKFGVEKIGLTKDALYEVANFAAEEAKRLHDENVDGSYDEYFMFKVRYSLAKYVKELRNMQRAA